MYVPEELKVNKFEDVHLPDNKSLFGRFGVVNVGSSMFTGDEVAHVEQNKIEELESYRRYAEAMAEEARAKQSDNPDA